MHATNEVISFSDRLSVQIRPSYAANAFNLFRLKLLHHELLRLCAIWDDCARNRQSLPTIRELLDDPSTIALAKVQIETNWNTSGERQAARLQMSELSAEQFERLWTSETKQSQDRANEHFQRLVAALRDIESVESSPQRTTIKCFRNERLAHSLDLSGVSKVALIVRRKDAVYLYEKSINLAGALHLGLTGADFAFDQSINIANRNAEALWHGCTFDVQK